MRQLLLTAALGLCACTDGFHSVGFYDKIDTMLAGGKTVAVLGVGDLNGDGRADVALANTANELTVLFSQGDGTFASGVSYPLDPIGNPQARSMLVGDLNGDGRADVIVGNIEQNNISLFMNQGDGKLVALQQGSMDVGCRPTFLVLHDMNADGRPDLVVGCGIQPNEIHILKNQGQGQGPALTVTFAGAYTHQWTTATSQNNPPMALGIAVGELNGDGIPDIAVATDTDLRILNSPKETGRDYKDYLVSMPLSVRTSAVGLGDGNGNGITDISALVAGQSVQVFEYATGGAYTQLAVYQNLGISGRGTTQFLGETDLSSDGKSDYVVTLNNPSEVKLVVSRGETGMVAQPVTVSYQYPTGLQVCDTCLSFGDVSGDGKTDIVLRNGNKVSVLISGSR
jgi:hypothetical protein